VGIAADVYHIWFDDALEAEIMASGKQGWLHAFHICDWKVKQADPLHDRGLMGEGVIDIRTIESWMSNAGYTGDIEVEIFSKTHWAKDPSVFLNEILTAYDACL
jgi:sugar phosphate isomerase/epimerase